MLSAAFMAVGVFACSSGCAVQHETAYLLFFNLAATAFMRGLHFYVDLPIENNWFAWLTVNALFWLVLSVHFFLCQLHRQPLRWLTRALVGVTCWSALLTLPAAGRAAQYADRDADDLPGRRAMMSLVACIVGGICAWRHSGEGRLVVYGVFGVHRAGHQRLDVAEQFHQRRRLVPGRVCPAVCFITFGMLMYRRYLDAIAKSSASTPAWPNG
jgi:signal transduction histidine kinase